MARQYKVNLFKIRSNHHNLRTDIIEGSCTDLPEIDRDFVMNGPGLEFGTRLIRTTPVKGVVRIDDMVTFTTQNSGYILLLKEEFDDEAQKQPICCDG